MPKISQLNPTAFPSLEHFFAAAKDGETVKISIAQIRALMEFAASEISVPGSTNVEDALTALDTNKANQTDMVAADNALSSAIETVSEALNSLGTDLTTFQTSAAVRYDASQSLSTPQKNRALANIGAQAAFTGSTNQYVRGDGSLATMNATAVGLGNVNNTSDAAKPISTATQTALNAKYDKTGGVFTGSLFGDLTGNVPTGLQLRALWASSGINGNYNISPVIKLKISRGGFSEDYAFGSMQYEEYIGSHNQLMFKTDGFTTARFFYMRSDGGFYAQGSINGSAKNFEIDHPSDPDNYDLRHCSTEAPEMLVEYRGKSKLQNGRVTVNVEEYFGVMPDTFKKLWADAWVMSLQNQDGFDRLKPHYLDPVTFEIECENPESNDEVTWLVMARRNDPYVRWSGCTFTDDEGRLIIEFEKPE